VQLLKVLAPKLMPLINDGAGGGVGGAAAGLPDHCVN